MKKALCLSLLIVLVIGAPGSTPTTRLIAMSPSLAGLMPADTFLFAEMRTNDVPGTVKTLQDVLTKANIPTNLLNELERSLSQGLGRPATLEKDITSWLGDRVGIGIYIPDAILRSLVTQQPPQEQPEIYYVAVVKDEVAMDAFLKDALASVQKTGKTFTPGTDTIGNIPVVTYAEKDVPVVARWKGYVALGAPSISRFLNGLKTKGPTLDADAMYQKTIGMLKPDNFATVYSRTPFTPFEYIGYLAMVGPRIGNIYQNIIGSLQTPAAKPTPTPSPTPTPTPAPELFDLMKLFENMGATAIGAYGDDKKVAVDFAFYVNPDRLNQVFTILKVPADIQLGTPAPSVSLKMAGRISNQAIAVIIGSNVPQLVKNGLTLARAGTKFVDMMNGMTTPPSEGIDAAYAQLESGLKSMYDLDLNQDVLAWMGGEFAGYAAYYPHGSTGSVPVNYTAILDTTDVQKTSATLNKLNAGLTKMSAVAPTPTDDGLFTFGSGPGALGYGLIKDELLVNGGGNLTAAANAVRGDGTLASDETWKETIALLPTVYQHVWYINLKQLSAALQGTTNINAGDQQMMALMNEFKSALLYSTDLGGGSSLTTVAVLLK